MVWVFSLSVECGTDAIAARNLAQHFEGLSWTLSNSNSSQCTTRTFQDMEDNWWCQICPDNLSTIGIEAPDAAYQMTEIGLLLYQRLRTAPPFRYALVGVEVDEFRTYSELIAEPPISSFPGLVLADRIWSLLGTSCAFQPFSSGYVWHPYEGKVYQPLKVSPDLKTKLNELLVVR